MKPQRFSMPSRMSSKRISRRKRPFPIGAQIAVDHAAMLMRADRDPAVNVRDDEIAVFITLSVSLRMKCRNCFLIQHMGIELNYVRFLSPAHSEAFSGTKRYVNPP